MCRFPNCTTAAASCDLDHVVPFDHDHPDRGGLTTEANLACLCRKHHRLKTIGDWTVRPLGDGRLQWRDPSGETSITAPEGPFADESRADGLRAGLAPALLERVTDMPTLANRTVSAVENDLGYLLDSYLSPRQCARLRRRRRSGHPSTARPRTTDPADTAPPF